MKSLLTKAQIVLPGLLLAALPASACPVCRPRVQAAIYNQHYPATALLVLLPVLLLAAGGVGLYFSSRLALWKTNLPRPLPAPAPPC
jgi:hypothetical protein